jgi:hypothetical protein
MKDQATRRSLRSAIYTRVSTDQGLEQDFNWHRHVNEFGAAERLNGRHVDLP